MAQRGLNPAALSVLAGAPVSGGHGDPRPKGTLWSCLGAHSPTCETAYGLWTQAACFPEYISSFPGWGHSATLQSCCGVKRLEGRCWQAP